MKVYDPNPQRILVVDDDEFVRLLYKAELEDEGYKVILAEEARKALDLMDQESPDLIILDIRMPDMNGVDALRQITGKAPMIPVIINSAYPRFTDNVVNWSAVAAVDYVVKSSDLQELKDKIRDAFARGGADTNLLESVS